MQVRSHGQVFQKSSPRTGKRTRTIEAHRLVSAKHRSSRQRQSQICLDVRKDHLRCKSTRGDMVSPPQAIDVAGQTFAPDGPDFIGSEAVQPTSRRNMLMLEDIVPGLPDLHCNGCLSHLAHPATCSSPGTSAVSPPFTSSSESRPGPRFPGLRSFVEAL